MLLLMFNQGGDAGPAPDTLQCSLVLRGFGESPKLILRGYSTSLAQSIGGDSIVMRHISLSASYLGDPTLSISTMKNVSLTISDTESESLT